jgi:hypothetical protein
LTPPIKRTIRRGTRESGSGRAQLGRRRGANGANPPRRCGEKYKVGERVAASDKAASVNLDIDRRLHGAQGIGLGAGVPPSRGALLQPHAPGHRAARAARLRAGES